MTDAPIVRHLRVVVTAPDYDDALHFFRDRLYGQRVLIAAIDDLIRMKIAARRRKDLLAAEELGALREELDRRPPDDQRT